ncbi:MAG: hypothetical protein PF549_02620 [Patescibacteria group bacterium]|jgi:hypothetical protein|nr:hypothetical protein [Patescibacteria group bacterium]
MGFGKFGGGFENIEDAYEATKEEVKKKNEKEAALESKRLEKEKEEREKEEKEEEEKRSLLKKEEIDVTADEQGETDTKILGDPRREVKKEKPKRPGFSKIEQGENFTEKVDQAKKDEDIVDVVNSGKK